MIGYVNRRNPLKLSRGLALLLMLTELIVVVVVAVRRENCFRGFPLLFPKCSLPQGMESTRLRTCPGKRRLPPLVPMSPFDRNIFYLHL